MASGGARRGRRDNGLIAAAYAAAGDVDPRVGEHLLDVLGLRGIAAYLQPAADLHPITRTTTLPSPPTDRLWVDREHLATARDYLAQLTTADVTDLDDEGVEDAFASIVAGFDVDVVDENQPWPDAENVTPAERPQPPDPGLQRWTSTTVDLPAPDTTLIDGLDTFGANLPDEEEEGYTPPPPPPLPRFSPVAIGAVLSIVAGLVLFFNPGLLGVGENVTMVIGFSGILAGFVALIWRLRSGNDDDDNYDPDDGAVV
ncbi:MAG TPA: DUF308 domain-containing protein [Rugosimonospora sp.]|nr:DUF308 domain-containing protein [Rugosimonospora sp.]